MHRLVVAGICVLAGWPAYAEPVALGNDTLKQAVAGKTVHLDTPFGVAIPITYHGNGLMSGRAGVLEYFLGAEADRGRWWVADGKLCQKWFKWLDAQPSCMRLQQDGRKIFWRRDDGLSGTATIASGLPPGAEAAPRGLGGPVQTSDLRQSLMATDPPEPARPATTSTASAPVHRNLKLGAPRAAAVVTSRNLRNNRRAAWTASRRPLLTVGYRCRQNIWLGAGTMIGGVTPSCLPQLGAMRHPISSLSPALLTLAANCHYRRTHASLPSQPSGTWQSWGLMRAEVSVATNNSQRLGLPIGPRPPPPQQFPYYRQSVRVTLGKNGGIHAVAVASS